MMKIFNQKGKLYEGPIWAYNSLYFVDIPKGELHTLKDDGSHRVVKFPTYVSSLQPNGRGGIIVTAGKGFYLVQDKDQISLLYEVKDWDSRNRFNDGKCDQMGRYWIGTMNLEEKYPTGGLFVLDFNMKFRRVLTDVTISNGLAWSLDNRYLYYIDSPTRKIFRFKFDLEKGEISQREVLIDLREYEGVPDGMTIDSEGNLWVALYGGGAVLRVDTEKRKVIQQLKLPAPRVTSVTFGGNNLKTLFITTANDHPDGGFVYSEEVDVRGVETYYCGF
ncbi:hypothetical protein SUSAZ_07930 [Sulfolobus acidocaldarius SUSAZ]|nr:hypothetical protein SUSAZ_07930 [Sulfolobus acidocaldarius SUSAZ]